MKLTREQHEKLSSLGQRMVVVMEQYKKSDFIFDAAIQSLRGITDLVKELMNFVQPFINQRLNISLELGHTKKIRFCKKRRMKRDIDELNEVIQQISSIVFSKELEKQIEVIFKGSPVRSINAYENYRETQIRNGFGLFEPSEESHVYDYIVKFSDGAELVWHTLQSGAELDKARHEYDSHMPAADYTPARAAAS